jgi:hypothetical protein
VQLTRAVEIGFAVAAVIAGASLAAALLDKLSRRVAIALAFVLGAGATAAWVAFALHERRAIAVAAAGITLATVAELAAIRIHDLVQMIRGVDRQLARAEGRLRQLIQQEAAERTAELERTLARARADSASLLGEQERRLSEERRRAADERERSAVSKLGEALTITQRQVETRFQGWSADLDRLQRDVDDRLAELAGRQRQRISDAEGRIAADAERLETESKRQRAGLERLRDELARAIQETVEAGNAELEEHAAERRRALHELGERIRRRERSLAEQIEREETEAQRRIQVAFEEVQRRQVEQLQRVLDRATSGYSDAAAQQFADAIRAARETTATRLARELDRAVQSFLREAERVLAERLAHVGDVGAQRLEKRLSASVGALEHQSGEALAGFEQRLIAAEQELHRRLEGLAADAEAERAVLEARLHELSRRIEEAIARA